MNNQYILVFIKSQILSFCTERLEETVTTKLPIYINDLGNDEIDRVISELWSINSIYII